MLPASLRPRANVSSPRKPSQLHLRHEVSATSEHPQGSHASSSGWAYSCVSQGRLVAKGSDSVSLGMCPFLPPLSPVSSSVKWVQLWSHSCVWAKWGGGGAPSAEATSFRRITEPVLVSSSFVNASIFSRGFRLREVRELDLERWGFTPRVRAISTPPWLM